MLIKISVSISMKFENMIFKFIQNSKGSKIAKTLLKKDVWGAWELFSKDIKLYYKAKAIRKCGTGAEIDK